MAATVTAPQQQVPPSDDSSTSGFRLPDRILGLPLWAVTGLVVLIVMGLSVWLRTRYINGQFWMDEGL